VSGLPGVQPPTDEQLKKAQDWIDFRVGPMRIALRGVCIMVEQHTALHRDRENRLHCTTGPAWAWADGTTVHALDGIRVPSWVITDPSAERIMRELPNTEQRRVALAHYGWHRVVNDLKLTLIDEHPDRLMGTLYALPQSIGDATLLVCDNASPDVDGSVRRYGLLASAGCRTVIQAQASLAGVSVAEFAELEGAS
jgi:hypothetical protein